MTSYFTKGARSLKIICYVKINFPLIWGQLLKGRDLT